MLIVLGPEEGQIDGLVAGQSRDHIPIVLEGNVAALTPDQRNGGAQRKSAHEEHEDSRCGARLGPVASRFVGSRPLQTELRRFDEGENRDAAMA